MNIIRETLTRINKKQLIELKSGAVNLAKSGVEELKQTQAPLSIENWYIKAAQACEATGDALLRESSGASSKIVRILSGKLGAIGTSASMFSLASLLGTASTGTAIGGLSGAAFTSASLAWLGGSVLAGSAILSVAAIAGSIGAIFGAGWAYRKFGTGAKREKSELEIQEQRILDVCLSLAVAFREQDRARNKFDPLLAKVMYGEALKPLCEELLECQHRAKSWPYIAQRRLRSAIKALNEVAGFVYNWSRENPNASFGIVSAVFVQLLAEDMPNFTDKEQMVLDALRRSNNLLTDASEEELSVYIQGFDSDQLPGLTNNIKGIYHELLFQHNENNDGDIYVVELFENTNHAGADVKIINSITGEFKEVQLKATDHMSYIQRHNEKYANIDVFATQEVASQNSDLETTDILNADLEEDVGVVITHLDNLEEANIIASLSVSGLITLARNSKVLLKGGDMTQIDKEKMIKEGVTSAGVAGLVHLIL